MFFASASLTASFWLCTLSCSQANCADWLPNSGIWMIGMTCTVDGVWRCGRQAGEYAFDRGPTAWQQPVRLCLGQRHVCSRQPCCWSLHWSTTSLVDELVNTVIGQRMVNTEKRTSKGSTQSSCTPCFSRSFSFFFRSSRHM